MKVGLLADTHDNLDAIRYFIDWFQSESVGAVIHAGDFVSPFTIPELNKFDGPVYGVFGNNDGDRETLLKQSENTTVTISDPPERFEVGNTKFLVSHKPSDLPEDTSDEIDVIVYGHTHSRSISRRDKLTINPGEAGGWLASSSSAMILETNKNEVKKQVVPRP